MPQLDPRPGQKLMQIAIMQPYFLPYIGYFQLMNLVDRFVIYDNIEYTKKGWINRNRLLRNGSLSFSRCPFRKILTSWTYATAGWRKAFRPEKARKPDSGAYAKAPEFQGNDAGCAGNPELSEQFPLRFPAARA